MGFWSFMGGILLCILAVFLGILGIAVLLGFLNFFVAGSALKNSAIPLGIGMLVLAVFLFAYGWYLYKSAKPRGTINVHNV